MIAAHAARLAGRVCDYDDAASASDVLAVELLQQRRRVPAPARVVPLFETSRDLQNAGGVLDELLAHAVVPRAHRRTAGSDDRLFGLGQRRRPPRRRLGSLQGAGRDRRRLQRSTASRSRCSTAAAAASDGAADRRTWRIQSQPPGSIDGTLRVTEQGEMIQALFGLPDIAVRTMEVYTTGTLEAWLTPARRRRTNGVTRMDRLAGDARGRYRAIVYDDRASSTTSAPRRRKPNSRDITSAAARRGAAAGTGVASLRAIPWQFAWTQTRLMLAPGSASRKRSSAAVARGERDALRDVSRVAALPVGDRADRDGARQGRCADRRRVRPSARADASAAAWRGAARPPGSAIRRCSRDRPCASCSSPTLSSAARSTSATRTSIRSISCRSSCCAASHASRPSRAHGAAVTINGVAAGMRNAG